MTGKEHVTSFHLTVCLLISFSVLVKSSTSKCITTKTSERRYSMWVCFCRILLFVASSKLEVYSVSESHNDFFLFREQSLECCWMQGSDWTIYTSTFFLGTGLIVQQTVFSPHFLIRITFKSMSDLTFTFWACLTSTP